MTQGPNNEGFFARRPHAIPAIIAAVMLLAALGKWPYGYYKVLRWVTCAAAVFIAYQSYEWEHKWGIWLFGFVAVLFNPLVPVHLTRDLWQPIDVVAAAMFLLAIFLLREPLPVIQGKSDNGEEPVEPPPDEGCEQVPEWERAVHELTAQREAEMKAKRAAKANK